MDQVRLGVELLVLLLAANGGPVIATYLLRGRASWPVDGGMRFSDGKSLLGASKTWRGVITAVILSALVAAAIGYPLESGAAFGFLAMLGDTLSSFCKRRLGLVPSARATGLDQIPEAVLPLWLMHGAFDLSFVTGSIVTGVFVVTEIGLSKLLYRWHIRQQPY